MAILSVFYFNHILISYLFDDKSFAWRSVVVSLTQTTIICLLLIEPFKNDDKWLIYFIGIFYFALVELPRFGILSDINESTKLNRLISFMIRNYPKFIIAFFLASLTTLLISYPDINWLNTLVFVIANCLLLFLIWIAAKRVRSKLQIKFFAKIAIIEGLIMTIILLTVTSIELINKLN